MYSEKDNAIANHNKSITFLCLCISFDILSITFYILFVDISGELGIDIANELI